jgi:hypothetical protein
METDTQGEAMQTLESHIKQPRITKAELQSTRSHREAWRRSSPSPATS